MSANRKTVRKGFDYMHSDDLATYLMQMARQGWHFRAFSAGLVFDRGEPEDAVYAVEVFIDGSEFDTRPEPRTQEFAEYCEAAGWKLIDARQKTCVFKKIHPDAMEIMTDQERLHNIAKEEQKSIWRSLGLATAWMCMQLLDYSTISFANSIFSNWKLMISALWVLLFITSLCKFIHFYIWKYTMASKILRGEPVRFGSGKDGNLGFYNWHSWASLIGCGMYLFGCFYFGQKATIVYFLVYLAVVLIMGALIGKFRPDSATNALIQTIVPMVLFLGIMVFSMYQVYDSHGRRHQPDYIPLYAQDIGLDWGEMENSSGYIEESVFGTHTAYSLHYENRQTMFYVCYLTQEDWILDRLWEIETDGRANENPTDCAEDWGAETGFQNHNGKYYLRYPNGILVFTLYNDSELIQEQISTILETLGLR